MPAGVVVTVLLLLHRESLGPLSSPDREGGSSVRHCNASIQILIIRYYYISAIIAILLLLFLFYPPHHVANSSVHPLPHPIPTGSKPLSLPLPPRQCQGLIIQGGLYTRCTVQSITPYRACQPAYLAVSFPFLSINNNPSYLPMQALQALKLTRPYVSTPAPYQTPPTATECYAQPGRSAGHGARYPIASCCELQPPGQAHG
jgi:hypothetical protein